MKQRTFTLGSELSLDQMVQDILSDPSYASASSRVLLVFEPDCDRAGIAEGLAQIRAALPDLPIVGQTTLGPLYEGMYAPSHTVCSLLLFDQGEARIFAYDCHQMTPLEAGRSIAREMEGIDHPRAVLCITSDIGLYPMPFMEAITAAHPHVPVFGTQAGTEELGGEDRSTIYTADALYDRGIIGVVFSGESLEVRCDHNMGFRPIGREMTVTASDDTGFVSQIDGQPAASVYKKYLDVVPDEFFYQNVCSFPLLQRSGRRMIARVPISSTPDGKLQFSMALEKDAKVSLSYSKPEYLLRDTLLNANRMCGFQPEALLLYACLNRRVFMGEERADREFEYYRNACESMAWCYGYGEICREGDSGGNLNSSIVAVGMREGEPDRSQMHAPFEEPELDTVPSSIPLADRMVTFLEATTAELNDTIDELAQLAARDQLTGIYNRRRIQELLAYEMGKRRNGDDLVLMMYDIDFFKHVNDTYGHEVGDIVLKQLTACVGNAIRSGDTQGRWGGEEFLILMTDTSLSEARRIAERIRRQVEQHTFDVIRHTTISIGVTCANRDDTPESLFSRVDKALYDAKHNGRNCIAVR